MTPLGHGTREQHPANKQRLTLHFSLHLGNLVSNYRVCLMAAVSCASLKASLPRAGAAGRGEGMEPGGGWEMSALLWLPGAQDGDELSTCEHNVPDTVRGAGVRCGVTGLCAQEGAPVCPRGHATHAILTWCPAPRLICSRRRMPLLRHSTWQGCAVCSSLHTLGLAGLSPVLQ